MTDTTPNLSFQIATLAENAGVDAGLLWDDADECPQGHSSWSYYDQMYTQGDLCGQCVDINNAREEQEYDLSWHPEWRFGRQAKDMTNPAYLLPALEAFLGEGVGYEMVKGAKMEPWPEPCYASIGYDAEGFGATVHEALAEAFLEKLQIEKDGGAPIR